MFKHLKEDINERFSKDHENINSAKGLMKIVQDLKVKIESLKKTQTYKTRNKNLRSETQTSEVSLTNRVQDTEERIYLSH